MRFKHRSARLAMVATALVLPVAVAAGCGSSGGGGGGGGGGDGAAKLAPEAVANDAKNLTILVDDVPTGLSWNGPTVALASTQFGFNQLYSRLIENKITYSPDGSAKSDINAFTGDLAESFEQKGKVWTFKLRKGVVSCAGNEMTADDVIYTYARSKARQGAGPIDWAIYSLAGVFDPKDESKKLKDEVKKIDDYTVEITQQSPQALFLPALEIITGPIIDAKEMRKHDTKADPGGQKWQDSQGAAGFGPYCLKAWSKGSEISYTKNAEWNVAPLPQYETVDVKKVPSAANRVTGLLSDSGDIATNLATRQIADLKSKPGIEVATLAGTATTWLHMNYATKPWDNIKLRQAVAFMLPYDQIVEDGYNGLAKRAQGIPSSVVPDFVANNPYKDDPAKAKALLAEAGFPDGKGLSKFPKSSFELSYPIERADQLLPVATIIASALKKYGVPVQLNPIPLSVFGDRVQGKRDLPFAVNDQAIPIIPNAGYAMNALFTPLDMGGTTDPINYPNAKVHDLWVNKANHEPDKAKRAKYVNEALDIAMEDVGILPIVENPALFPHRDSVTGFVYLPDQTLRLRYLRWPAAPMTPRATSKARLSPEQGPRSSPARPAVGLVLIAGRSGRHHRHKEQTMKRLGCTIPPHNPYMNTAQLSQLVQHAEAAGYAAAFLPEAWSYDTTCVMTRCALETSTIEIGSAILPIEARTPAQSAMAAVAIDDASGGRHIHGLGAGHRHKEENWHGLEYKPRVGRFKEYVEIVREIFSGREMAYRGEHLRCVDYALGIEPYRRDIPIYLAALGLKTHRMVGQVGDGVLAYYAPPGFISTIIGAIREGAESAGRTLDDIEICLMIPTRVSDDPTEAIEARAQADRLVQQLRELQQHVPRRWL